MLLTSQWLVVRLGVYPKTLVCLLGEADERRPHIRRRCDKLSLLLLNISYTRCHHSRHISFTGVQKCLVITTIIWSLRKLIISPDIV